METTNQVLVILLDKFEAGFEIQDYADFCSVVGEAKYRKLVKGLLVENVVYVSLVERLSDVEEALNQNEELAGRRFKSVFCPDCNNTQQRLNKIYASRN